MDKISLNASMRNNLLSLQNISKSVSLTQNRLSNGLKVNSAIDNPSSYYTAVSLNNRANDLSALLDSMGQAIQTIKAATTGLEAGTELLAQASAVATQTLSQDIEHDTVQKKTTADFETEGYTRVSSGAEITQALADGKTKLVLDGNISVDSSITITQAGIKIEGNGHTMTYNGSKSAVFSVDGAGELDIRNLMIEANGEKVYGVRVTNGGTLTIDNAQGFKLDGAGSKKIVNGDPELYNGKANTEALLNPDQTIGDSEAKAAQAANAYTAYEGDKGYWYLPSMGEMMQLFNTDTQGVVNNIWSTDGADKSYFEDEIEDAIKKAGGDPLQDDFYWSSSECYGHHSWVLSMRSGHRHDYNKDDSYYVRSFQLFENCFNPVETATENQPKAADIMYQNTKNGKVLWRDKDNIGDIPKDYVAIGVITNVSDTGDVTIVALQDAVKDSSGKSTTTYWSTDYKDVGGVQQYDGNKLKAALQSVGTVTVENVAFTYGGGRLANSREQYNEIMNQYDQLVSDSSYKGVNVLSGDALNVRFNEDSSSSLDVQGKDMATATLGLNTRDWQSREDVVAAVKEIASAVKQIRSFQTELGNNYSIITNRQEFTESLINVLTEGADKLTLADMNEESANMLALQTRQQLAVNALSLASQASQGILKLF